MVIQVRKSSPRVERKLRPAEQQNELAGGELPSPDFTPPPTQEESMDMFRRQRQADIEESGGRSPQSEDTSMKLKKSIMTGAGQEEAVLRAHIKTMRELGYDDDTIKANMPGRVLKHLEKKMDEAVNERDILDLRDERQKLIDKFFEAPTSIGEEDRSLGRRPSSEEQSSQGRMRQAEFEAGKERLDSIYYPSGHPKAGELTPHGEFMWGKVQSGILDLTGMEEVRKNQDEQRKQYKKYGFESLKAPTE